MRSPSPALVVSLVALAVALGGTGYAVTQLPKNSVGAAQLKKDAVTGAKVKAGSLEASDFKPGQLPAGAPGATGAPGPQGERGPQGEIGPSFAFTGCCTAEPITGTPTLGLDRWDLSGVLAGS